MNLFCLLRRHPYLLIPIFFLLRAQSFSQSLTPRSTSISPNCNGFYEYLPAGYESANTTYPLLIFMHGADEEGNGSSDLSKLLKYGPLLTIRQGNFPASFHVNGQEFSFIIIAPQFVDWPKPTDVDALIDYSLKTYKVNAGRIYLTGLSMGGGGIWDYVGENISYCNRVAGIVPICGASGPDLKRAATIAFSNLPVWATHNDEDPTVPVSNTNGWIDMINGTIPLPAIAAKKTIFKSRGHDAWTTTYNLNYKEAGLNVYEWMLQYERTAQPLLPVLLSSWKASVSQAGEVSLAWTTSRESSNDHYLLERSDDGSRYTPLAIISAVGGSNETAYSYLDKNPFSGTNFYRMSQVDVDGKTTIFPILKAEVANLAKTTLMLSPNPAANEITLMFSHPYKGMLKLSITDAGGAIVKQLSSQKDNASWQRKLRIDDLKAGFYLLQVSGTGLKLQQPFIKN